MKEFIKQTLVEFYRTCPTDKYGQVGRSNFTEGIFGDKAKEVREYVKENKGILSLSTYAASYGGTYKAYSIVDEDIKRECSKAKRQNKNYLRNINSY